MPIDPIPKPTSARHRQTPGFFTYGWSTSQRQGVCFSGQSSGCALRMAGCRSNWQHATGKASSQSCVYIDTARPTCFRLEMQAALQAARLDEAKTGQRMPARMTTMATTTSSSTCVNPLRRIPNLFPQAHTSALTAARRPTGAGPSRHTIASWFFRMIGGLWLRQEGGTFVLRRVQGNPKRRSAGRKIGRRRREWSREPVKGVIETVDHEPGSTMRSE